MTPLLMTMLKTNTMMNKQCHKLQSKSWNFLLPSFKAKTPLLMTLLKTLTAVLDLAIDAIREEASSCTSSIQIGHSQHLGRSPGERNCVAINRCQDVVASGGIEDALIITGSCAIKRVTGSRDGVDDGGHVGTVWSHDVAVLDESCADVASMVGFNSHDTCEARIPMSAHGADLQLHKKLQKVIALCSGGHTAGKYCSKLSRKM